MRVQLADFSAQGGHSSASLSTDSQTEDEAARKHASLPQSAMSTSSSDEVLSARRPSVVSLQTQDSHHHHPQRAPSPVSAALGVAPSSRHPADHQISDGDEEEQQQARDDSDPGADAFVDAVTFTDNLAWHPSANEAPLPPAPEYQPQAIPSRITSSPPSPRPPLSPDLRRTQSQTSPTHSSTASTSTIPGGPSLSIANSPLARLSAEVSQNASNAASRRSFFGNFLKRSPNPQIQYSTSATSGGFVSHHQPWSTNPGRGSPSPNSNLHERTRGSSDTRAPPDVSFAFGTRVGLGLDVLDSGPSRRSVLNPFHHIEDRQQHHHQTVSSEAKLRDMGLEQSSISSSMSLSRYGQPLCGVVLDDQYLLIGTTTGLDFLPLKSDRHQIRKPVPLIKRTRFKQIALLQERSNVLLAVAGRNDHVRVYALDGVRAMIDRKMRELNTPSLARSIVNAASGHSSHTSQAPVASRDKGKARARPPPMNLSPSPALGPAVQQDNGPITPPPPYLLRRSSLQQQNTASRSRGSSTVASVRTHPSNADLRVPPQELPLSSDPLDQRRGSVATVVPPSPVRTRPTCTTAGPSVPLRSPVYEDSTEDSTESEADNYREGSDRDSQLHAGDNEWERPSEAGFQQRRYSTSHLNVSEMIAKAASMPKSSSAEPTQFLQENDPLESFQAGPSVLAPTLSSHVTRNPNKSRKITRRASQLDAVSEVTKTFEPPSLLTTQKPKLVAKSAIREHHSTCRDLIDFLQRTEPPVSPRSLTRQRSQSDICSAPLPHYSTNQSLDSEASGTLSTTTSFANDQDTSPSPRRARLRPRPASMAALSNENLRELANLLREDIPPKQIQADSNQSAAMASSYQTTSQAPYPDSDQPSSHLSGNSQSEILQAPSSSPRQRKRWSEMLEGVLRTSSTGGSAPPSLQVLPHTSSAPASTEELRTQETIQDQPEARPTASAPLDLRPGLKRKSSTQKIRAAAVDQDGKEQNDSGPSTSSPPSVDPASVTTPSVKTERHPASATAPLEYVKLARTKGTRFIRTLETPKRTFLAVLCGESGERIELFTGSKNVSLPLNRTFVLPESPRTIEFQLQGDELVDIYLVYDESIFALEPSTVRVREVGIARHERRAARRERERERERSTRDTVDGLLGETNVALDLGRQEAASSIGREEESTAIQSQSAEVFYRRSQDGTRADSSSAAPGPTAFTTFQQLMFIPPLPASVLAPAYVIPPTYNSVISSNPMSSQEVQPGLVPQSAAAGNAPLLSPISLLSSHLARSNGPPGLFYVSRGKQSTSIVDADGRSVIKRAIPWKDDTNAMIESGNDPDMLRALHVFHRIEILLVDGKTIMVGVGATEIQAVELGRSGTEGNVYVVPEAVAKRRAKSVDPWDNLRDVVYLGSASSRVFWSERVGNNVQIHCLQSITK